MTAHTLVLVLWDDAWQDQENFSSAHGIISTHHPMAVQTLGWLIQDDEVGVSVVNEKSIEDGTEVYRGRTFVPRAMIKSVTPFKLTKVPKKKSRVEDPPPNPSRSGPPDHKGEP